jgi:PIN domain nuclease of toxin-antitoxin system
VTLYLLDTNQFIFALQNQSRLTPRMVSLLEDEAPNLALSVVSLWEVMLKNQTVYSSGSSKLPLVQPLPDMMDSLLALGVSLLELDSTHIFAQLDPPLQHNNPFDQLLLKQCKVENLKLLTSDARLTAHPLVLDLS